MIRLSAVCALLLLFITSPVAASDADLENALAKKYRDTILLLRHPAQGDSLQFSPAGELLSKGAEGPWTLNSGIEITKFTVAPGQITLECTRYIYGFEKSGDYLRPFRMQSKSHPKARIEIALDTPLSSQDQADSIIQHIFAANEQELAATVPDYWRWFLQNEYGSGIPGKPRRGKNALPPARLTDDNGNQVEVTHVDGKKVMPPRDLYTPEPSYAAEAREMNVHGTLLLNAVIDAAGRVKQPRLLRPLGMGLDEKAIDMLQQWKFKPAMRDGKPIAVEMALEISFDLH